MLIYKYINNFIKMRMNYLISFMKIINIKYQPKPEELICIKFASFLREMSITGKCKHIWFHVSNEGSAPGKHLWGSRQRNMGKFAGVSDYVFMGPKCLALEIKNGNKKLQESQEIFKKWCEDCNVPYHVAGSYEEAVNILKKYEII